MDFDGFSSAFMWSDKSAESIYDLVASCGLVVDCNQLRTKATVTWPSGTVNNAKGSRQCYVHPFWATGETWRLQCGRIREEDPLSRCERLTLR